MGKRRAPEFEGEYGYWFVVEAGQSRGWVFAPNPTWALRRARKWFPRADIEVECPGRRHEPDVPRLTPEIPRAFILEALDDALEEALTPTAQPPQPEDGE